MGSKLKVLFVSSEVSPFVKTGGLADVAGSLPVALKELGHDVNIVMPEYKQIPEYYKEQLEHVLHFRTRVVWRDEYVGINKLDNNGVTTYLVDNKNYFYRDSLYENEDKHIQFTYFCRAIIEMLPKIGFKPDIIHCNDWQTGPLCIMLKDNYKQFDFYKNIKTVFTIHNLQYQGKFGYDILEDVLGISHHYWDNGVVRHDGLINFMKMGIMESDAVTTVSHTYAEEIKDPYYGYGLDYAVRLRGNDLYGILNGISYDDFNPATDTRIYTNYDLNKPEGKYENKARLQEELGLPVREDVPVIGMVSRLVEQKGLDLVIHILDELMQDDIQFVVLGTGNNKYEHVFWEYGNRYPEKISVNLKYDPVLAQKIYAGSDIFLMPSRFEPCGLGQLISLRYGTIPVVRETGGLKDTVKPYNEYTGEGNGFSFANYNAHDMLYTIRRAVGFYHDKDVWNKLVRRALSSDFSWKRSALEYENLYHKLTGKQGVKREDNQESNNQNTVPLNGVEKSFDQEKMNRDEIAATAVTSDKININKAAASQLQKLDGIGPAFAKRIVEYRQKQGRFKTIKDITKVKGISKSKYNNIKDDITV
ncbi:glycogen synthase GlgA [Halothermothrix orenii]|uniref:Glycogen synthase n=1 Tax=Halothermothrix orenii (strain H 168 / OCM 544 / DSM 9562) TaxID=373903 RepID=B8CVY2_HALOH|nr:glycogen synthase GlgA [Halothermothrix orenii]ACL69451.1 glycogen/starch synthase, ADP-glucose type [Halothermothrix orenii H 168]